MARHMMETHPNIPLKFEIDATKTGISNLRQQMAAAIIDQSGNVWKVIYNIFWSQITANRNSLATSFGTPCQCWVGPT